MQARARSPAPNGEGGQGIGRSTMRSARMHADAHVSSPHDGAEHRPAAGRWRELGLWWCAHALVAGAARVLFEASLPAVTRNPRFSFADADVPRALQVSSRVKIRMDF